MSVDPKESHAPAHGNYWHSYTCVSMWFDGTEAPWHLYTGQLHSDLLEH